MSRNDFNLYRVYLYLNDRKPTKGFPELLFNISTAFPVFRFSALSISTHEKFVYIVDFTEISIFAPFLHVRVCREKGTHAKLKIFVPQTQFSIHSSDGRMETFVVKIFSLLKLSIIRAGIFDHSLTHGAMDRAKAWNKVLEAAQGLT
mgnify:CR=1 FL=1